MNRNRWSPANVKTSQCAAGVKCHPEDSELQFHLLAFPNLLESSPAPIDLSLRNAKSQVSFETGLFVERWS